jgi:hypothetical protein
MKQYYLVIFMIFVYIISSDAQNRSEEINLNIIVKEYNDFPLENVKEKYLKNVSGFDFRNFQIDSQFIVNMDNYYKIYYNNNHQIIKISWFNQITNGLNFEFYVRDYDGFRLFYGWRILRCDNESKAVEHECRELIKGFFVQDKKRNVVYFFGTKYDKMDKTNIELNDIYCIMKLDENMFPLNKLVFYKGNLSHRIEYIMNKELEEKLYIYAYQVEGTQEVCYSYNNLAKLDLEKISFCFLGINPCPVTLKAKIISEIPKEGDVYLPEWSLNIYYYK